MAHPRGHVQKADGQICRSEPGEEVRPELTALRATEWRADQTRCVDGSPEGEERRQMPGEGKREVADGRSLEKEVNATRGTGDAGAVAHLLWTQIPEGGAGWATSGGAQGLVQALTFELENVGQLGRGRVLREVSG